MIDYHSDQLADYSQGLMSDRPQCPITVDGDTCENRDYPEDWHACQFCRRPCCADHMALVGEEWYCADHAAEERAYQAAHPQEGAMTAIKPMMTECELYRFAEDAYGPFTALLEVLPCAANGYRFARPVEVPVHGRGCATLYIPIIGSVEHAFRHLWTLPI